MLAGRAAADLSAGATVVDSPLLSLVQDQVAALLVAPGGGVPAACLSSALPAAARPHSVCGATCYTPPRASTLTCVRDAKLSDAIARMANARTVARAA